MRVSCGSLTPSACEPYLEDLAAEESSTGYYYVSMLLNPSTSVSYAEDFSKLSLTYKHMLEIGFDDFIGRLEDDQIAGTISSPNSFVLDVISATTKYNPNLMLGVTLYEDQLTHTMTTTTLTASTRAKIKCIHLFLHYREDASRWNSYVSTAKSLFPNARIIAGAYPYDRIDYLPCAQGSSTKCTAAQEQSYYKLALENQAASVKAGSVAGLEFFFGYFGEPQDWSGWTGETNACLSSRLSQCYANTTTLQTISQDVVTSYFSSSSSTSSSSSSSPGGSLHYDSTALNLGSVSVGDTSSAEYVTITNTGSTAVTFHSLSSSGNDPSDFTQSFDCPQTLGSGSSCTLVLYFRPKATGTRTATLNVPSTAGTRPIYLTGTGK